MAAGTAVAVTEEDMLDAMGQLFGPVRGGLGYSVILVGFILGAITGTVAAQVIAMALISLPVMIRYKYDMRYIWWFGRHGRRGRCSGGCRLRRFGRLGRYRRWRGRRRAAGRQDERGHGGGQAQIEKSLFHFLTPFVAYPRT